jgi:hypothetical protein
MNFRRGSALLLAAAALLFTTAHGARLFDTDTKDIDVRVRASRQPPDRHVFGCWVWAAGFGRACR